MLDEKHLFNIANEVEPMKHITFEESGPIDSLIRIYLNGMHDDERGSVSEEGLHVFRVDNWTLETDSQGFTEAIEHDTINEAISYLDTRFERN